jgi:hypothetical protein
MVIHKIINGYVVQSYDTRKKRYISQEFVADDWDYETLNGEPVEPPDDMPYLSLNMEQPKEEK